MAFIKYYPLSRIQTGLYSRGSYLLNGQPYTGAYYLTYKGEAYTGANPTVGGNELLVEQPDVNPPINARGRPSLVTRRLDIHDHESALATAFYRASKDTGKETEPSLKQIVPYYPIVLESDYKRGYFMRYFAKRIADKGYIMEISYNDWIRIRNENDPTYQEYEVEDMMWQLVGPMYDTRISQYQVKGGVYTTNKRVTEGNAKNFIGLVEFIGGDYTKFARVEK